MEFGTLAMSGILQLVAALSYGLVGRTLGRRDVPVKDQAAAMALVAWWWGLGLYMLVQGVLTTAAAFGWAPFPLFLAARFLTIPLLTVAVAGLTFHILYLLTGARRALLPVMAFYGVVTVLFFAAVVLARPTHVNVQPWLVELGYGAEGAPALWRVVYVATGVPPIAAAFAYLAMIPQLTNPLQRYRAALVGVSLLAWVGGGLAARLAGGDLVIFFTLVILGLVAAAAVYLAYHPPRWVEARLDRPPVPVPDEDQPPRPRAETV